MSFFFTPFERLAYSSRTTRKSSRQLEPTIGKSIFKGNLTSSWASNRIFAGRTTNLLFVSTSKRSYSFFRQLSISTRIGFSRHLSRANSKVVTRCQLQDHLSSYAGYNKIARYQSCCLFGCLFEDIRDTSQTKMWVLVTRACSEGNNSRGERVTCCQGLPTVCVRCELSPGKLY